MGRWRRVMYPVVLAMLVGACATPADVSVGAAEDDGVRFPVGGSGDEIAYATPEQRKAAARDPETGDVSLPTVVRPGERPITANICGARNVIDTGPYVQFPWAPPCVKAALAPDEPTARGVTRTTIKVAYYISGDPKIQQAARSIGGCGSVECWRRYVRGYTAWFNRYFELYGRQVVLDTFVGSASEASIEMAEADADKLAAGGYFAVLNGPGESGGAFAARLASRGVLCFCTLSLPERFYRDHSPYVWSWLMSSTQAYVHRAAYIRRLAGRKATWAGTPQMRATERRFGLVWFNNSNDDYDEGVAFFRDRLASYGVHLATAIEYRNIEGCQTKAGQIVDRLFEADVTSVIFAGDPLCPTSLTAAAQARSAPWEWIVTGSVYTDMNVFARLYDQTQWRRAFGVSMLTPVVDLQREHWARMLREVDPMIELQTDMAQALHPFVPFFTGVHMAGPKLDPRSFAAGIRRLPESGGTVTVPRRSYGSRTIAGVTMQDHTSFDDMTEIWWDPDARDVNGNAGAYRYVDRGRRYTWERWPETLPNVFTKTNAILGYERPPDQ